MRLVCKSCIQLPSHHSLHSTYLLGVLLHLKEMSATATCVWMLQGRKPSSSYWVCSPVPGRAQEAIWVITTPAIFTSGALFFSCSRSMSMSLGVFSGWKEVYAPLSSFFPQLLWEGSCGSVSQAVAVLLWLRGTWCVMAAGMPSCYLHCHFHSVVCSMCCEKATILCI